MRYLTSTVLIVIGALIVLKSEWLLEQLGRVDWAEEHLGAEGGSRLFYKLVGLAIILASLLYMSGILQDFILFVFVPARRG